MDPSLYHAFYELEDRHWWFVGRRAIVDSLLRDVLSPGGRADRRILDVGCGTGGMLPLLSRFGKVTGIDMEPLALDYCRRRGIEDVHLQQGFEAPEAYDVVTLFDVLEHVEGEAGFLARLRGYLKPGGFLVVTVPAFQWLWSRHDDLNLHKRRYTRKQLVSALERAGFEVKRSTYFNMLLFPAAAAIRLLSGKGRNGESAGSDEKDVLKQLRIGGSNRLLAGIFSSERLLLRGMELPFGVSLFAIAMKK